MNLHPTYLWCGPMSVYHPFKDRSIVNNGGKAGEQCLNDYPAEGLDEQGENKYVHGAV